MGTNTINQRLPQMTQQRQICAELSRSLIVIRSSYHSSISNEGTNNTRDAYSRLEYIPLVIEGCKPSEYSQGTLTVVDESKVDKKPHKCKRDRTQGVEYDDN